jgi:trehalose 6-phosphate phosphatase
MTGEAIGEATGIPVEARKELRTFAANETQVSLEEKTLGLAVHYRGAPHLKDDVDMAAHDVATRYGLSVKRGKAVAEIVAKDAGKDGAVRLFMAKERFAGSLPVFIGDDVTDEDGFAAAEFFGGFGIVVGDREPTAARYRLADPAAVHAWLGLEGA